MPTPALPIPVDLLLSPVVAGGEGSPSPIRASPEAPRRASVAYAGMGGAAAFAGVLLAALVAGALLRRRRRPRPLARVLLARSVRNARER